MEHRLKEVGPLPEALLELRVRPALGLTDEQIVDAQLAPRADARVCALSAVNTVFTSRLAVSYFSSGTIEMGSPAAMRRSAKAGI